MMSKLQPWAPGHYGKAVQSPDGELIIWRTSYEGGDPYHSDGHRDYRNPININPDGTLSPRRKMFPNEFDKRLYSKIFEDEPRLTHSGPYIYEEYADQYE